MPVFTLVTDVRKVVETLRNTYGEYHLAMLYNSATLDSPTNWNLIISSDWADGLGVAEATRRIAKELHLSVGIENRTAVSRITVLKTTDPFVRDMTQLYLVPGGQLPLSPVVAGGITEGAGFVFHSRPEVPA
ncbi:MAG TPA: hypothetical protein VJN93_12805 [Candidatus Acidoferrum sp.]|nr:hypothetical protein [Candidatus Acidoferrum sp.]